MEGDQVCFFGGDFRNGFLFHFGFPFKRLSFFFFPFWFPFQTVEVFSFFFLLAPAQHKAPSCGSEEAG